MATTKEQNERLTRIGPGTPMGSLLRRYWQPVAATLEFVSNPVKAIRILGEDLTLYRDRSGTYGLIAQRCAHRGMALKRGVPERCGLRCAYHGWVYDASGQCIEQPFEDRVNPEARFKDRIHLTAYPVEELGGLLFAYFGPQPAPLLPRWDLLVQDHRDRAIEIIYLPCNWLQCMDNAVDPLHFEFLHAHYGNYAREQLGKPPQMKPARHLKIAFDVFRYGIMKRRLLEGDHEDCEDWMIGHPLLFPNALGVGNPAGDSLQFRVPIDDTNTLNIGYWATTREPGTEPRPTTVAHLPIFESGDPLEVDTIPKQDFVAWVDQGTIADRTQEHLTAVDQGVILYHKLLFESMDRIERGDDPMALVREPLENNPMIELPRERARLRHFAVQTDDDYLESIRGAAQIRG